MPVHSDVEDPIERLRAIVDSAEKSKRVTNAIGKELARDLLETLPAIVAEPLLRNAQVPRIGLIVSNVRGPDVPLYMAGAQLVHYVPISIAIDGMGINITAFSYAGNMWICAISCREMLPDPAFFADCMRTAFEQMQEGARREAAFTVADTASGTTAAVAAEPADTAVARARHSGRKRKVRAVGTGTPRPARRAKPSGATAKPKSGRRKPSTAARRTATPEPDTVTDREDT
jgi:diacylglycerol O-acyltransferase